MDLPDEIVRHIISYARPIYPFVKELNGFVDAYYGDCWFYTPPFTTEKTFLQKFWLFYYLSYKGYSYDTYNLTILNGTGLDIFDGYDDNWFGDDFDWESPYE